MSTDLPFSGSFYKRHHVLRMFGVRKRLTSFASAGARTTLRSTSEEDNSDSYDVLC